LRVLEQNLIRLERWRRISIATLTHARSANSSWQIPPEVSMALAFCLLMMLPSVVQKERPVVEVFMPAVLSSSMDNVVVRAQSTVKAIYSEIGVHIVWRSARSAPGGCSKQPLSRQIVVTLREKTPPGPTPDALAMAYPFSAEGPCVTLLMDRLEPMALKNPLRTGFLLGHVLAYEIGHVLQGIDRHSELGVMKSRWSETEIITMSKHPLQFTSLDLRLILSSFGLESRR
jgi:hypothetical protein